MSTAELIIKSATNFYNDLTIDENCRYRSWEYCYSNFVKVRGNKEINYDYLSLQLAFYLASWGCIEIRLFYYKRIIKYIFQL